MQSCRRNARHKAEHNPRAVQTVWQTTGWVCQLLITFKNAAENLNFTHTAKNRFGKSLLFYIVQRVWESTHYVFNSRLWIIFRLPNCIRDKFDNSPYLAQMN